MYTRVFVTTTLSTRHDLLMQSVLSYNTVILAQACGGLACRIKQSPSREPLQPWRAEKRGERAAASRHISCADLSASGVVRGAFSLNVGMAPHPALTHWLRVASSHPRPGRKYKERLVSCSLFRHPCAVGDDDGAILLGLVSALLSAIVRIIGGCTTAACRRNREA